LDCERAINGPLSRAFSRLGAIRHLQRPILDRAFGALVRLDDITRMD
jgi:hypothetical protein